MIKLFSASAVLATLSSPVLAQAVYVDPNPPARGYMMDPDTTGSIVVSPARPDDPVAGRYSNNPAADGNASQINKPVPNYGQTSEGNRAFYE